MLKSIEIKNFKSIDYLRLNNLKQVNLISGKNSSGKTTFLEAIFLFLARHDSNTFHRLMNWRGLNNIQSTREYIFSPLFKNYDLDKVIEINIWEQTINRHLHIKYNPHGEAPALPSNLNVALNLSNTSSDFNKYRGEMLELHTKGYRGNTFLNKVTLTNNSVVLYGDANDREKYSGGMISTAIRSSSSECVQFLDKLTIKKNDKGLVEILQIIEPNIKSIHSVNNNGNGSIYVDIGHKSLIPLEFLGDGINRLLYLILSIIDRENGILLIDELERGFHHSILDQVWDVILLLAHDYNCQIFATTHSYELLQNILPAAHKRQYEDIEYIRLDVNDKNLATEFSIKEFNNMIKNDWEVR
jgi:AAA15 family ATPase/GTPase